MFMKHLGYDGAVCNIVVYKEKVKAEKSLTVKRNVIVVFLVYFCSIGS